MTAGPFRRDVRGGADEHAGGGDRRVPLDLGDAEVGEHDAPVLGDQHVGRLHVAVQDALAVRRAQHVEDGEPDLGGPPRRQRAVLADRLGERLALDQLHDDPRAVVLVDHVVDGHRAVVADPCDRLGLTQGARDQPALLVLVDRGREPQFLDRDRAAERLVVGAPDRTHAASAEHLTEPVAPREETTVLVPLGLSCLLRLRHASPLRSTRPGRAFIVPHPGTGPGAGSGVRRAATRRGKSPQPPTNPGSPSRPVRASAPAPPDRRSPTGPVKQGGDRGTGAPRSPGGVS